MKLTSAAFSQAIGALAERIGTRDFEEQLLQFIGTLVRHDMRTLTRYSRFSQPEYLVHSDNYSKQMASRYLAEYYRFDPFYRYWQEREKPGVVWLNTLSSAAVKRGRYVRDFLADSGINDEVGIFLPPVGRASVALFLERSQGRFSRQDRERLQGVYPVVAGLHKAHANNIFGGLAQDTAVG